MLKSPKVVSGKGPPYNEHFLAQEAAVRSYQQDLSECLKVINPVRSEPDLLFTKTSKSNSIQNTI